MPRLLKTGTIRRIQGAQEMLRLALCGLAFPRCADEAASASRRSADIGLLGCAAELILSACIHEIEGENGLVKPDGRYLVAREVLGRFRNTLRSGVPKLAVLSSSTCADEEQLRSLLEETAPFTVLFSARAGALHAGEGVSHDVAMAAAVDVAAFMTALARADRWTPYLRSMPLVPPLPRERLVVAEELARSLESSSNAESASAALRSVFIVLPELVEETPEWLGAFDRVQVAPRKKDLAILLKSLRGARTGDLLRVGRGSKGIAARIENENLNALPVRIERFRRSATSLEDRFQVDITEANTYLDQGILRVPPIQSIYDYFAVGVDQLGLPEEVLSDGLTAHEVWPVVAGALGYVGTAGPTFFIARFLRPAETGQLLAQLQRAAGLSPAFKRRLGMYELLLRSIALRGTERAGSLCEEMSKRFEQRLALRTELNETVKARLRKARIPDNVSEPLLREVDASDDLGSVIEGTLARWASLGAAAMPMLRDLVRAATEREEVFVLLTILSDLTYAAVHTDVRKALRDLDFGLYCGPPERGVG